MVMSPPPPPPLHDPWPCSTAAPEGCQLFPNTPTGPVWQALYLFMFLMKVNEDSLTLGNCTAIALMISGDTWPSSRVLRGVRSHRLPFTPPSNVYQAPLHTWLTVHLGTQGHHPTPGRSRTGIFIPTEQTRKLRYRGLGLCRKA